jgi:hypothetical protein
MLLAILIAFLFGFFVSWIVVTVLPMKQIPAWALRKLSVYCWKWAEEKKQKSKGAQESMTSEPRLNTVTGVLICDKCLDGVGGICNTPGCLFIRKTAPDLPLRQTIADFGGTITPEEDPK